MLLVCTQRRTCKNKKTISSGSFWGAHFIFNLLRWRLSESRFMLRYGAQYWKGYQWRGRKLGYFRTQNLDIFRSFVTPTLRILVGMCSSDTSRYSKCWNRISFLCCFSKQMCTKGAERKSNKPEEASPFVEFVTWSTCLDIPTWQDTCAHTFCISHGWVATTLIVNIFQPVLMWMSHTFLKQ